MEIKIPPFEDLNENGEYTGNDISFLIKNNNYSKEEALKICLENDEYGLTPSHIFNSQLYILNKNDWEKLSNTLGYNINSFDTIVIKNYFIFKKQN
jgi:hypothetical protein